MSSPAVVNGVVYVGSYDGSVHALNAATGEILWNSVTGCALFGGAEWSPAVANGMVYIGDCDYVNHGNDFLFDAVSATTGELLWQSRVTDGGLARSSPAVANGVVYVGSAGGTLFALDADTGAIRWARSFTSTLFSSPAVANGVVYAAVQENQLYALNADTGAILWQYDLTGSGWYLDSSPAVANGVVYMVSGDSSLYAFHLPGK